MSAISLFSCSRYSSKSGIGHTRSPARVGRPAARCSTHASGVPNSPVVTLAERDDAWRRSASRRRPDASRPACCAYQSASPRISRPSASVLMTSTVLPLGARQDVAGLDRAAARHVLGRRHDADDADRRLRAARSRACAPTTAAPPAMSSFIRSMPSAGLIEMPPVSNVMPLPTRPSTGPSGAPGGSWRSTISRGGSALPRATPSSSPMPSAAISFSSRTSTSSAAAAAISAARVRRTRAASARCRARCQLAREVAALAEDGAPHRGGTRGRSIVRHDDPRAAKTMVAAVARLVDAGIPVGQHDAFGHRLRGGRRLEQRTIGDGHGIIRRVRAPIPAVVVALRSASIRRRSRSPAPTSATRFERQRESVTVTMKTSYGFARNSLLFRARDSSPRSPRRGLATSRDRRLRRSGTARRSDSTADKGAAETSMCSGTPVCVMTGEIIRARACGWPGPVRAAEHH